MIKNKPDVGIVKMPCEICGDDVPIDAEKKRRRTHLCKKHRGFARKELRAISAAMTRKKNMVLVYKPKTENGRELLR